MPIFAGIALTLGAGAAIRQYRKWSLETQQAQSKPSCQSLTYQYSTHPTPRTATPAHGAYAETQIESKSIFNIVVGNKRFEMLPREKRTERLSWVPHNDAVAEQLRHVKFLLVVVGVLLAGVLYSWRGGEKTFTALYVGGNAGGNAGDVDVVFGGGGGGGGGQVYEAPYVEGPTAVGVLRGTPRSLPQETSMSVLTGGAEQTHSSSYIDGPSIKPATLPGPPAPPPQTSSTLSGALSFLVRIAVYLFSLMEALSSLGGHGLRELYRDDGVDSVYGLLLVDVCKIALMYWNGLSWWWALPSLVLVIR